MQKCDEFIQVSLYLRVAACSQCGLISGYMANREVGGQEYVCVNQKIFFWNYGWTHMRSQKRAQGPLSDPTDPWVSFFKLVFYLGWPGTLVCGGLK